MDNDDELKGRLLKRREVLALLSAAGASLLAACAPRTTATPTPAPSLVTLVPTSAPPTAAPAEAAATEAPAPTIAAPEVSLTATPAKASAVAVPACVISPELTEGPLFVDEKMNRSDIRPDTSNGTVVEGAQLDLTLMIGQVSGNGCAPLAGATVDIWHCDAQGIYSDTSELGMQTVGQKFLRGSQVTDAAGAVKFITIYPGWYTGRAVHIHIKVRGNTAAGQGFEFTSQLFFDEALSDTVFAQTPYNSRDGSRRIYNERDNIYGESGGQTLMNVVPSGSGYATSFYMGMQV
jgi:protocatechuate 3,4-dioxygenase beta subunit